MPKLDVKPQKSSSKKKQVIKYSLITVGFIAAFIIVLPTVLIFSIEHEQEVFEAKKPEPFPVTVNPQHKLIVENPEIDAYLEGSSSPLQAAVSARANPIIQAFKVLATTIAEAKWYQGLASVVGIKNKVVTINPGLRKEQVAMLFSKALKWTDAEQKEFLTTQENSTLPLEEGSYSPGTYVVNPRMSPTMVQELVNKRFTTNVLDHYSSTTASIVPLDQALTIASIVQRETIGNDDVRLISGIIWNRLFHNMNLQVDATLQYAKANTAAATQWWPTVVPKDKYIKSEYNTYANSGLPPTPISNPSVGAILATLNPIKTSCLYYFNDKKGKFHCSVTYKEHVALIKKYYGN